MAGQFCGFLFGPDCAVLTQRLTHVRATRSLSLLRMLSLETSEAERRIAEWEEQAETFQKEEEP